MFNLENLDLNKTYILSKVSEFQIFSYYCKNFKELNKRFSSELRTDNKPSCCIKAYSTGLYYKDFTTEESFNCFTYIQVKFKLIYNLDITFYEVLRIIANDFKIIRNIKDFRIEKSLNYVGIADKYDKTSKIIRIKERNWYKADTYWKDYHITKEILNFFNVKPLSNYWVADKKDILHLVYSYDKNVFDPCYSYEEGNGIRKILRPYSTDFKWVSNIPRNLYSGYKQINSTNIKKNYLIVTSSLKDVMCWKIFGYDAIAPQSESIFLSYNAIELLKYKYNNIIVNYDNDNTGLKRMQNIVEEFPDVKRFITNKKDISDNIYYQGLSKTEFLVKNFKQNLF